MTVKIEEGKFYRDVSGRKVGPMRGFPANYPYDDTMIFDSADDLGPRFWLSNGERDIDTAKDTNLVGEWLEPGSIYVEVDKPVRDIQFASNEEFARQQEEIFREAVSKARPWEAVPIPMGMSAETATKIATESRGSALGDTVNHPSHYTTGGIECYDAMAAMLTKEEMIGYLRGNSFKYRWRFRHKGGAEDLRKAEWYEKKLLGLVDAA